MAPQPPSPRQYLESRMEHIGLVRHITRKRKNARAFFALDGYMSYEDIVQDALLQCVLKHETYDPAKGKLSTHYGFQIMGVLTARKKKMRTERRRMRRLSEEELESLADPNVSLEKYTEQKKFDFLMAQAHQFDPAWKLILQAHLQGNFHIQNIARELKMSRIKLGRIRQDLLKVLRDLGDAYPSIQLPHYEKISKQVRQKIARTLKKEIPDSLPFHKPVETFLQHISGELPNPNPYECLAIQANIAHFVTNATFRTTLQKLLKEECSQHE